MSEESKSPPRIANGSAPKKLLCEICGKLILRKLIPAHMRYGHQVRDGRPPNEGALAKTIRKRARKAKEAKVKPKEAPQVSKQQLQASKITKPVGIRVDRRETCSFCKKPKNPVWRFSIPKGDSGYICESCRSPSQIRKQKKPKRIDALDRAVSGGGFETNRRRH